MKVILFITLLFCIHQTLSAPFFQRLENRPQSKEVPSWLTRITQQLDNLPPFNPDEPSPEIRLCSEGPTDPNNTNEIDVRNTNEAEYGDTNTDQPDVGEEDFELFTQ